MSERNWFWMVLGSGQAFIVSGIYLAFHDGPAAGQIIIGAMQIVSALVMFRKSKRGDGS